MNFGIPVSFAISLLVIPRIEFGQTVPFAGLPSDADVIETQELPPSVRPSRLLALWMEHPEKHPRQNGEPGADEETEPYTCPEATRGWFYRGPTRVSLVDTLTNGVI